MVLKMGIVVGILILTGAIAWMGIAAACVYLLSMYKEMVRGPEATYHESSTYRRPPRVSKSVFNRIKDRHRPSNAPADLEYGFKYTVLFEKKLEKHLEYICFPSAILEPGMGPHMLKFKQENDYRYVLLDLRSTTWVAVKSI